MTDARRQAARQLALIAEVHLSTDNPSLAVPVVVSALLALTAPDEPTSTASASTSAPSPPAAGNSPTGRPRDPHVNVYPAHNPRSCRSCPDGTSPHLERHYLSWRVGGDKHSSRACDARLIGAIDFAHLEQRNFEAQRGLQQAALGAADARDVSEAP